MTSYFPASIYRRGIKDMHESIVVIVERAVADLCAAAATLTVPERDSANALIEDLLMLWDVANDEHLMTLAED